MRRKAAVVVIGLLFGACGFQAEQFTGDAALPPPTVGFAQETSLQDEASGDIQVIVRLSRPAPEPISVNYAFVGGTALRDVDYTGEDGTLSFAVGETEHGIPLQIALDTQEEQDETIELALTAPSNAELGVSHHTITISAKLLPRVSFTVDVSEGDETGMATVNLSLDSAPLLASSATIGLKAGGTAVAPYDFSMPSNLQVDFPINTTTGSISVPITVDTADEDDEDFTIEIATTQNVIIDPAKKEHRHTIHDNDDPPVVSISASASGMEGNTGTSNVTVTVTITPASGKIVTVPITYGGGTATEAMAGDFTYQAKPATLVFMPNSNPAMSEVSKSITIQINGDTVDEDNQTIITSLTTAPTNGTLTNSPNTTNTYTITDDDDPPTVKFMTGNQTVGEGDSGTSMASFTLVLSAASERMIAFDLDVSGTASVPMDYTTTPATTGALNDKVRLAINPVLGMLGATTTKIDITVKGEMVDEGPDETVIFTISPNNLLNVTQAGADQSRMLTIDDMD